MSVIVAHLDRQVESARRLLGIVIEQSAAIRDQDVEGVLVKMAELQGEMVTRAQLEQERDHLIQSAADRLGVPADAVDLDAMLTLEPQRRPARTRPLGRAQGPRHRDLPRARPEPPARPAGALVPRPPDARALGHAAVRLLQDGLSATPQIANAVNAHA